MTFEYCQRVLVDAELDIPNIGECAIIARTDLGEEYYLIIYSDMGFTHIVEYGPAIPDLITLPMGITYTYDYIEYSDYKLEKRIDKFLNNPKRGITQAQLADLQDILPNIKSPAHVAFSGVTITPELLKDEDEELDEE